jgi:antirestriction protein ArdC
MSFNQDNADSTKGAGKIYQMITDRIIDDIEKNNILPWNKPWAASGTGPENLVSGKAYKGINRWLLGAAPFGCNIWASFKQIKAKGGAVNKGEKGYPVIFWKMFKTEDKETGKKKTIPMLRYYTVFNLEQQTGVEIPERETVEGAVVEPLEAAEAIFNGYEGPAVAFGGDRAFYAPSRDSVTVPERNTFTGAGEFYSTLFHELAHSTGHKSRLDRFSGSDYNHNFGSADYSREELIAEFSAAYLCGISGINNTITNSTAYIAGWVKKLRNNNKWLINGASAGEKAARFILGEAEPVYDN